ncbi:HNH endonuclease signature motif containing protein [Pigmentiphaga daeguensis]|uniref:HNH endonuclease n=1 Tax=Pigmentiphaga daeguensis TaxID=414049 RepID=UPI0031D42D89
MTEAYVRNPDVVAEALHRARGQCGRCKQPAPFSRRKDGSPYLEVHHIQLLKDGGEDRVENAIALCPNCPENCTLAQRGVSLGALPNSVVSCSFSVSRRADQRKRKRGRVSVGSRHSTRRRGVVGSNVG